MNDARPHTPESLARYLDRVRSSYPFGILTTAIRTPTHSIQSLADRPLVSFIAVEASQGLPSEHNALIDSIVSKGLKLALDRTTRRVVTSNYALRTALEEQTALKGVVIVLGAQEPDGRLEEFGGACILHSHSLRAIASDPAIKRAFWGHLQTVLGRIS